MQIQDTDTRELPRTAGEPSVERVFDQCLLCGATDARMTRLGVACGQCNNMEPELFKRGSKCPKS